MYSQSRFLKPDGFAAAIGLCAFNNGDTCYIGARSCAARRRASIVPKSCWCDIAGDDRLRNLSRRVFAQPTGGVNLGTGDTAVLNYAFALEQLEAEFYSLVAHSFYSGIGDRERHVLTDIRDHEIAHADFYRAKLGSSGIPKLQFNFQP